MAVRARWGVLATLLAVVLIGGPALAGAGTTSNDVPARREQPTALVRTSTADAPVQVNVDIGMTVKAGLRCTSPYPGACKTVTYHPCFNPDDPAYSGCELYTFYRVIPPGADLTQGIAIGSTAGDLTHDWGRKITEAHLEVYAADPLKQYGDVRLRVNGFPYTDPLRAATAFSEEIGHINLPFAGAPGTGTIAGMATGADGKPMAPRSFKFDVFGRTDTGRPTGLAGEGKLMEFGFGRAAVEAGVANGYFSTRPLFTGTYDIHVQRIGASYSCRVKVAGAIRFDLDFGKDRLGHPGCVPLRPLARTVPG